jgi:defect-in-organelle-trafficking protein DotC
MKTPSALAVAALLLTGAAARAETPAVNLVGLCGQAINAANVTDIDPVTGTVHFTKGKPLALPARTDPDCKRDLDAYLGKAEAAARAAAVDRDLWMTALGVASDPAQGATQGDQADPDAARLDALRDAALQFGEQAGAANEAMAINRKLARHAGDTVFDFAPLLIKDASGATILPPVLLRKGDPGYEESEGATLTVSDIEFRVVQPPRLVSESPTWQSYLMRPSAPLSRPEDALLPKTEGERIVWAESVHSGWDKGAARVNAEFLGDAARLIRDYAGMYRYHTLADKHLVAAPVVEVAPAEGGGQTFTLKPFAG